MSKRRGVTGECRVIRQKKRGRGYFEQEESGWRYFCLEGRVSFVLHGDNIQLVASLSDLFPTPDYLKHLMVGGVLGA